MRPDRGVMNEFERTDGPAPPVGDMTGMRPPSSRPPGGQIGRPQERSYSRTVNRELARRSLALRAKRLQRLAALGQVPATAATHMLDRYNTAVQNQNIASGFGVDPSKFNPFTTSGETLETGYISPYEINVDPNRTMPEASETDSGPVRRLRDANGKPVELPVFGEGPLQGVIDASGMSVEEVRSYFSDRDYKAYADFLSSRNEPLTVSGFGREFRSLAQALDRFDLSDEDADKVRDRLASLIQKNASMNALGSANLGTYKGSRFGRGERYISQRVSGRGVTAEQPKQPKPITQADVRKRVNELRRGAGLTELKPGEDIPEQERRYAEGLLQFEQEEANRPIGEESSFGMESPFQTPIEEWKPEPDELLRIANIFRDRNGIRRAAGITELTTDERTQAIDFLRREFEASKNGNWDEVSAEVTPFYEEVDPEEEPGRPVITEKDVLDEYNKRTRAREEAERERLLAEGALEEDLPAFTPPLTAKQMREGRGPNQELERIYNDLLEEAIAGQTEFGASRVGGATPIDQPAPVAGAASAASPSAGQPVRDASPPIPFIVKSWQSKHGDQFPAIISAASRRDRDAVRQLLNDLRQFQANAREQGDSAGGDPSVAILANSNVESLNKYMRDAIAYASAMVR